MSERGELKSVKALKSWLDKLQGNGLRKGEYHIISGATNVGKSVVLPNTCANYGFLCDDPNCNYVTQSEDDHIIVGDEYLCLECAKKRGLK